MSDVDVDALLKEMSANTQATIEFNRVLSLILELQSELSTELARSIDRLEHQSLLIIGVLTGKEDRQTLVDFMANPDRASDREAVKRLIKIQTRNLNKLRETEALYGLDTPLSIQNQIENITADIEQLEEELEQLNDREA